jgi:hypothetical protein
VSRDTRANGQREGRGKREEEMGGDAPPVVYLLDLLQPVDWTGLDWHDWTRPGQRVRERAERAERADSRPHLQDKAAQCSAVQCSGNSRGRRSSLSLSHGQSRTRIGREFSTRAGRQAGRQAGRVERAGLSWFVYSPPSFGYSRPGGKASLATLHPAPLTSLTSLTSHLSPQTRRRGGR